MSICHTPAERCSAAGTCTTGHCADTAPDSLLCLQVVNKGAEDVRDEIESAIYQAAVTILAGEGFSFGVPSRAKGNQLYVPELDRIVLKDSMSQRPFASSATCRKAVITARILGLVHELCLKRIHVTKRDLFYTDVKLFEAGAWGPAAPLAD